VVFLIDGSSYPMEKSRELDNIEFSCAAVSISLVRFSRDAANDPDGVQGVNCNDLLCCSRFREQLWVL